MTFRCIALDPVFSHYVTFSSNECEKELIIMLVLICVVSFRGRTLLLRLRGSYCSQIYFVFILSIYEHVINTKFRVELLHVFVHKTQRR